MVFSAAGPAFHRPPPEVPAELPAIVQLTAVSLNSSVAIPPPDTLAELPERVLPLIVIRPSA